MSELTKEDIEEANLRICCLRHAKMNNNKHPIFKKMTKEQIAAVNAALDRTVDRIYNSWPYSSSINTAVDAALAVPNNPVVHWTNARIKGTKYAFSLDRVIGSAITQFGKESVIVGKDSLNSKDSVGIYIPLEAWLKWNLSVNKYNGNEEQRKNLAISFVKEKLYDRTTIGEITWFSEQKGLKPEKTKVKVFCEPKMLCTGDLK
jgi:hypothetical protein